jgi:hypothetical protein
MRKFVQPPQPKNFQKRLCRSVKIRSSQLFRSTYNFDQPTVHQLPENLTTLDTSDGFYFGTEHRLPVRNDGQRFHRWWRQANLPFIACQSGHPGVELRPGAKLETASNFHQAKSGSNLIIQLSESSEVASDLGGTFKSANLRNFPWR